MIFAPLVTAVMRFVLLWMVFAAFKMIFRWLNRELVEPVKRESIRRASARILVEEERPWGDLEIDSTGRFEIHDA